MKITIYGKSGCSRCDLAKWIMPEAEYRNHVDLYDRYDMDTATGIVTASGGELPIIVVESDVGRLVLGPSEATVASGCVCGMCTIPAATESILGHENAENGQS